MPGYHLICCDTSFHLRKEKKHGYLSIDTCELRKAIPPIRGQEGGADPTVYVRLHRPGECQAWLITELEGDVAFAWSIDHDDGEYGDFYLSALVEGMPEVVQIMRQQL